MIESSIASASVAVEQPEIYFPLRSDKTPAIKNWQNVQRGVYAPTGNYGIVPEETELIIDCDPRNYPDSLEANDPFQDLPIIEAVCIAKAAESKPIRSPDGKLETEKKKKRNILVKLLQDIPELSKTRIVKTPSGYHLHCQKPANLHIAERQPKYPGIEFKSKGRYVVGPGSYFIDAKGEKGEPGKRYEYVLVQDAPKIQLRLETLASLVWKQPPVAKINNDNNRRSLSMHEQFKLDCLAWPLAISGNGGNNTTFNLTCMGIRDYNLPDDLVFMALRDIYTPRLAGVTETWSDAELWTFVENANRYGKNARGCGTPEAMFADMVPITQGMVTADQVVWQKLKEIKTELLPVPVLSLDLIPEPFQPWLGDVARRMQTPLDFIAAPAIVMVASVIGAGCAVKPKRKDNWLVVPNLWGAVVARPGKLKTPALAEAFSPLARLEAKANDTFKLATAHYEVQKVKHDTKSKAITEEMKSAAKKELKARCKKDEDKTSGFDDLGNQLASLPSLPLPVWRRYKTNDTTVPKLAEILAENPRGICMLRDELVGLLKSWDKPGNESDRAFFLEAWSGKGSHTDDRIGRGTTIVPNACVSIFGGIQPSKLLAYLYEAMQDVGNDGLVQRFQILVFPDTVPWNLIDEYPDRTAINRAFEIVEKLADMNFTAYGAEIMPGELRPYFSFDDDAQEFFYEWWTDLENKKLTVNDEPIILEHLSKYRSLMPSLALIFHLIEIADGKVTGPITKRSAIRAAQWCHYLEQHARRAYGLITNLADQAAARLADKIKEGKLESPFTVRLVGRKEWTLLSDKNLIIEACEDLVEANWLRAVTTPSSERGGRGTTHYFINPAALVKTTDDAKADNTQPITWDDLI